MAGTPWCWANRTLQTRTGAFGEPTAEQVEMLMKLTAGNRGYLGYSTYNEQLSVPTDWILRLIIRAGAEKPSIVTGGFLVTPAW